MRFFVTFITALATLILSACATPASIAPGTTEADTIKALGQPTSRSITPGVGPRLLYSGQPYGFEVWALQFDAQGREISAAQMLTEVQFAKIRPGDQTRADIERLFGPPAEKFSFRLINETANMYRFLESGVFKMAFWVQFTPQDIVSSTGITLDPWSLRDGDGARH
ncbi:MAG: hypothetical protein RR101_07245 [Burkholderiaceae bacterium]